MAYLLLYSMILDMHIHINKYAYCGRISFFALNIMSVVLYKYIVDATNYNIKFMVYVCPNVLRLVASIYIYI